MMKRDDVLKTVKRKAASNKEHVVIQRLDESLPLQTEQWAKVEQMLMRLTEFAPTPLITDLVSALANYADDQARRGYVLGQEDFIRELKEISKRVA